MPLRSASKGEIVSTYVKALLPLAEEKGITDQLGKDLEELGQRLRKNPFLMKKLLNPTIRGREHMIAMHPLLEGLHQVVSSFVARLSHYQRLPYLLDIISSYHRKLLEKKGFLTVYVESANALKKDQEQTLKKVLKAIYHKEIILDIHENLQLLGGFRVQIQSTLVDCSLVSQLSILHKNMRGE